MSEEAEVGKVETKGITLSWGQFGVALASFIISLLTPLLMFINQTSVGLALLTQRIDQHDRMLEQSVNIAAKQEQMIQRLDQSLTRAETKLGLK